MGTEDKGNPSSLSARSLLVVASNGEGIILKKRIIALVLSFTLLMTSVAYGAIPNNSVIIWSKAYSIDYLMDESHIGEINQAIAEAGPHPIFFQLPGVAEVFTDVFTMAAATPAELAALPEIEYKDAQGNKTNYAAGFGEAINDFSEECLSLVQTGYFQDYPGIPIKAAFEYFFDEPTWEYYLVGNEHIVEFVGGCLYDEEPVTISIQFLVNLEAETFVAYIEQDGEELPQAQSDSLMEVIFSEYYAGQCLYIVQNGYFYEYPDTPLMTAFETFFGNPSWEYFLSTDDYHVVEFVGSCNYGSQEAEVLVQFLVYPEDYTFEVWYCEVWYSEQDVEELTQTEWDSLLEDIFEAVADIQGFAVADHETAEQRPIFSGKGLVKNRFPRVQQYSQP